MPKPSATPRYAVHLDPDSDAYDRSYVVFDTHTLGMPFRGTQGACWRYVRALDKGRDHDNAERLAVRGGVA